MADVGITELDELSAEKVSGVGSPANGTPWVLLKSRDVRADPESPHTESAEADAQEERMTKDGMDYEVHAHLEDAEDALTEAKIDQAYDMGAEEGDMKKAEADEIENLLTKANYCGVETCSLCKDLIEASPLAEKAKLKAKTRAALPTGAFALPGKRAYPIHDENHARAALSMLHNATPAEQTKIKAAVHRKFPGIGQTEKDRLEKSPGVPDESVAKPIEARHLATGQSGLAGPATGGPKAPLADDSQAAAGESTYIILAEGKLNPPNPPHAAKSWEIEVVEKGNWVVLDPPATNCPAGSASGQKTASATAPSPSEEEMTMTTVTKEELDAHIGEVASTVVKDTLAAERKAAKKAAKKAKAKKAKKKAKMPFMPKEGDAEKNANNGGDITAEAMRDRVHGEQPANDVNAIPNGGHVESQYVNKEAKGGKGAKRLAKALEDNTALLAKMSQRPRSGGPVLHGQVPPGAFPAMEGRTTEPVAKGTDEAETLKKAIGEAEVAFAKMADGTPEKMQLGEILTLNRLKLGHLGGTI